MARFILIFASISGAAAVALGAFGAHSIKEHLLQLGYLDVYQTAVKYQFYHTLLLFVNAYLLIKTSSIRLRISSLCLISGILLFSGSLYFLSISGIKSLGMITPAGGILLIAGWIFLGLGIYQSYPVFSGEIKG